MILLSGQSFGQGDRHDPCAGAAPAARLRREGPGYAVYPDAVEPVRYATALTGISTHDSVT